MFQGGVAQLLQDFTQLFLHLQAALLALLQLCTQAVLMLTGLLQGRSETYSDSLSVLL